MSLHTTPRLYINTPLHSGACVDIAPDQAHYIRNVMRKGAGDILRVFNGTDGEFSAAIQAQGKRGVMLDIQAQTRPQVSDARSIHLITPVLKKDRMDILIEKSVELGMTDLHPVITDHADIRTVNEGRITAQLIEAAEQSERLTVPVLHPLKKLHALLVDAPIFAALERAGAQPFNAPAGDIALLIGPAGGWSAAERDWLQNTPAITPVTLGANILRAETAAIMMLARAL